MSYNILYSHDTKWGRDYRWPTRARELFALVRRHAADLIGFQEVTGTQLRQLEAALPEYRAIVTRCGKDSADPFIANPVFYRPRRLRLLRSGWRWLAACDTEAADLPGPPVPETAPGWSDRHAVWALFEDGPAGGVFFHLNTHWPTGRNRHAHPVCADALVKMMDEMAAGLPRIVTGDFNTPGNPMAGLGMADARSACPGSGPDGSKVNRDSHLVNPGSAIDHILVSPGWEVERFATIDERESERYPSDHLPVMAVLAPGGRPRVFSGGGPRFLEGGNEAEDAWRK